MCLLFNINHCKTHYIEHKIKINYHIPFIICFCALSSKRDEIYLQSFKVKSLSYIRDNIPYSHL